MLAVLVLAATVHPPAANDALQYSRRHHRRRQPFRPPSPPSRRVPSSRPVPPPPRNLLCNGTLSPGEPVERWVTGMPPPAPRPRAPAAGHKHICRRPRPSASCPWRGSSGPFLTGAQDQTPTPQNHNTCGGTPPLMYVDGNIWFTPTSQRHSLYTSYLFFLWSEIETLAGKRMDIYHFIFKKR